MTSLALGDRPALVLIDVQVGFDEHAHWGGNRNNPNAEDNMALLLSEFRRLHHAVFHVKHDSVEEDSPLRPNQPGNSIKAIVAPLESEPVIAKSVNSGFIGTNLEEQLRNQSRASSVVIVGLTSDHCVSTTTRMSGNLGFTTFLVNDAVATFDKEGFDGRHYPAQLLHDTALASLHKEFATIVNTSDLLQHLKNGGAGPV